VARFAASRSRRRNRDLKPTTNLPNQPNTTDPHEISKKGSWSTGGHRSRPLPAHLHVAFDEVERRDGHVGEAAAGDSSGGAGGIEGRRVHLDLLVGRLDRERHGASCSSRGRSRGGGMEARGGACGGEGARRGGVEEAREERLAGAVGERHRRREIRKIRLPRVAFGTGAF
jgi:hypothetical protein